MSISRDYEHLPAGGAKPGKGEECVLPRGVLILHNGWIILGIKPSASAQHIRDISGSFLQCLRINGRRAWGHNARRAGLGDGGKNAIQRSLKADHQTLHDLVEDYN